MISEGSTCNTLAAALAISVLKENQIAKPELSRNGASSSGEFVGMIADDPGQIIELKTFHAVVKNDHTALKREQEGYKPIPLVRKVTEAMIQLNYHQIRQDIEDLVMAGMERVMNDPSQVALKKN